MIRIVTNEEIDADPAVRLDQDCIFQCLDTLPSLEWFDSVITQRGKPRMVLTNSHPTLNRPDIPCYYLPNKLLEQAVYFDTHGPKPDYDTRYCFNFMINKKYLSRFMLMRLVEYHGLDSCRYTYSGIGRNFDWSPWLHQADLYMSAEMKTHMLAPTALPAYFPDPGSQQQIVEIDQPHITGQRAWMNRTWPSFLHEIFGESAVSLITESVVQDDICIFTEKTLFSVLALNFPIWVGGYKQAEQWQSHGFDIFDDVIDHTYQDLPGLVQRCLRAIEDNLHLLRDLELVRHLRSRHRDRLLANRQNMAKNIVGYYKRCRENLPDYARSFYYQGFDKFAEYAATYQIQ